MVLFENKKNITTTRVIMKRLIFISCLVFLTTTAFSQKTRMIDLCDGQYGNFRVRAIVKMFDYGLDTLVVVLGKNNRYSYIVDHMYLYYGSTDEVFEFFRYCRKFLSKEDKGTMETINKTTIVVQKTLGVRTLHIYPPNEGGGFTELHMKSIDKIVSCLSAWKAKSMQ